MTPERQAIVEEVLTLAIAARESLRHPKHATVLIPLRKRLAAMLARRWRKQQRDFLAEARHWLGKVAAGHFTEAADPDLKAKLQRIVTAKINAGTALSSTPSRKDSAVYAGAIEEAASGAIDNLSIDLEIETAAGAGQSFARSYLAKKGFTRLAADIDGTTRDRMANAVADVFAGGGTLDAAVWAIKDAFSSMKETRAETIAQTELADAYNQAMLESAKEAGDELLKVWNLDGEGCPEICEPNAEDGAIGLDEEFNSGDDAPPAHPNCDCSIGFVRAGEE